jgi:cytochrome oxidase Cu insertion factor (SCO1/SenC/PrrC family)
MDARGRSHDRRLLVTSQTGAALTKADLIGRVHVASFMFTTCPNLCPRLVEQLKRVADAYRNDDDMRLVSYSVTPGTDTPARLAAFGREHGIDAARWRLVTGDAKEIARLARDSYFADDRRLNDDAGASFTPKKSARRQGRPHPRRLQRIPPYDITRLIGDIRILLDLT